MKRNIAISTLAIAFLMTSAGCKKQVAVEPEASTAAPAAAQVVPAAPQAPTGKTTVVTIKSTSPGSFELALPVHSNNQRIRFEELKDVKGTWEQTFGGERIRSLDEGAQFTIEIINDKPEIPFLQTLDGATVDISYDGQVRTVSLKGSKYDWRPEKLY